MFLEDDFKDDNDLRLACLVLDQQVKIINGNETNLLVPQDWMNQYIEDQKRGTQKMESQQSHTPQIQVQSTHFNFNRKTSILLFHSDREASKVVAPPVAARPRIMPKTGMIIKRNIFVQHLFYYFRRRRTNAMSALSNY